MIIAASALHTYLLDDEIDVKVCYANGEAWKTFPGPAVRVLADRRLVTGRGSHTRLKAVYLERGTTPDQAEDVIEKAIRASLIRGRLANSQASQTCIAQRWISFKGIPTMAYKHVRGRFFGPRERSPLVVPIQATSAQDRKFHLCINPAIGTP